VRYLKFLILFFGLLFSFLIIPEAFSQIISDPFVNDNTWYMGKGLKIGDYFSYGLCHVEYHYCKEFQMDFKIIGETQLANESFWISEVKVEEDNRVITGKMQMSKLTAEPTIFDVEIEEYVNAFESSVWFLGAFGPGMGKPVSLETNTNWNDRETKDIWVSIDFIGGPILIGPTKQETVLTPAGLFNSTVASWKPSGHESNIWISPFISFPVKAKVWTHVAVEQVIEYEFELLDYGNKQEKKILPPIKQVRMGVNHTQVMCVDKLNLIFKATNNSPACVKSSTAQKLLERGWTVLGNP